MPGALIAQVMTAPSPWRGGEAEVDTLTGIVGLVMGRNELSWSRAGGEEHLGAKGMGATGARRLEKCIKVTNPAGCQDVPDEHTMEETQRDMPGEASKQNA